MFLLVAKDPTHLSLVQFLILIVEEEIFPFLGTVASKFNHSNGIFSILPQCLHNPKYKHTYVESP